MPKADPGPELRAAWQVYLWITQYPQGSRVAEYRWNQLLERRTAQEVERLTTQQTFIEDTVRRFAQKAED